MVAVNARRLRELRHKKRMSQDNLASEAKVTKRQIQRLERQSEAETVNVRERTAKRLAGALGVQEHDLLNPILEQDAGGRAVRAVVSAPPVTVAVSIDPVAAQCVDLVCLHYGVSPRDILSIAPALFVLAAEESLNERRRALAELRVKTFQPDDPVYDNDLVDDSALDFFEAMIEDVDIKGSEAYSIAHSDLSGRLAPNYRHQNNSDGTESCFSRDDFSFFLENLIQSKQASFTDGAVRCSRLNNPNSFIEHYWRTRMPAIRVLRSRMSQIAGGDPASRRALDEGWVRVSEIPLELMDSARTSERISKIRDLYAERTAFNRQGSDIGVQGVTPDFERMTGAAEAPDGDASSHETDEGNQGGAL